MPNLSIDVKDSEARADLADLEDYVESMAPVSLSVTENGTYTAPTGVFGYSPVVVDTSPKLPDTYEQIEYVKVDGFVGFGTTNYISNYGDIVEIESSTDTLSGEHGFFGANGYIDAYYDGSSLLVWGSQCEDLIGTRTVEADTKYTSRIRMLTNDKTPTIGYYSNSSYFFYGKLYSYNIIRQIYDQSGTVIGTKKIIDFIPVKRKSDNKVGMYDLVNQIFCVSTTGVDFTAPSE